MSHMIIMPVLLPLLTGILLLLASGRSILLLRAISLLSVGALVAVCLSLLNSAASGTIEVYALGNWAPPFGIVLVLDRLSALMLVLTSVLALFSLCYASADRDQPGDNLHSLSHFLLMGLNGAFLTGDIFNLFVFFEVLLLASYGLLLHGGGQDRARSGLHYVVLNLAGSSLFLIAVAVLYGLTGTLNMADMSLRVTHLDPADTPLVATAGLLLLLVFGLKAAMLPLYFWLPRAYAAATAPVAAMFAIMTKVGVYAIIRIYTLIFGETAGPIAELAQPWLWPLSLLTLALGCIGVLAARTLRVQIAYLLIVSIGTLLAGVAMHTAEALAATLYYLLHSTLICAALFMLADLIGSQRGDRSDRIVMGPAVQQPVLLGIAFFVAAISVVGLPPLSGFVGKAMVLRAVSSTATGFWLWPIVLVSSLAAMAALSRSGSTIFWRAAEPLDQPVKPQRLALWSMLGLLAMGPALAIWGDEVMQYTRALSEQLMAPEAYIRAITRFHTVTGA